VLPEGYVNKKTPVTPSGIKPVTFRLLTQCLNHLHHHVPLPLEYDEFMSSLNSLSELYLVINSIFSIRWFRIVRDLTAYVMVSAVFNSLCYELKDG
jgi:hypothetical protein